MVDPSVPPRSPLEDDLVLLGRTLVTSPAPDVRGAVRDALTSTPALVRAPRTRPLRTRLRTRLRARVAAAVAAVAVLLAGALVVSPAARAAAVRLLSFVGIELVDEPPPAPPGPGTLPDERPVTVDEARRQVRFPVLVPSSLGVPDAVSVSDGGRVVTLRYEAASGRPAIRVDESGDQVQSFFQKYTHPALAEYVQVGADVGVWVRQAHEVAYVDGNGVPRAGTVRLAAQTLLVDRGGVTVRIEGATSLEAAVAIAKTLR